MTPTERLNQIEARLAHLQAPPWAWEDAGDGSMIALGTQGRACFDGHVLTVTPCKACRERGYRCLGPDEAHAEFLAAARVDVAWLVARVRELEGSVRGIREFALTHEVGQPHNILLYALVVTIPQRVETALTLPTPGGRGGGG